MKTITAPSATPVPTPVQVSTVGLEKASPEAIRDEIARTRAHMDESLSRLSRKIRPRLWGPSLWLPLAALASLAAGYAAYLLARRASHPKAGPTVTRFKVRTAGMIDHIRTLQLAASVVRKGKPAILIVEPRKS